MQFYGEDKNLFLVDIPNPLAFVNDQKRAKKDECKKFMAEIDWNNRIIAVDEMVKVPTNKKNMGWRRKKSLWIIMIKTIYSLIMPISNWLFAGLEK